MSIGYKASYGNCGVSETFLGAFMSDIFDEVDDILNEIETETASAADTAEKSFNESELQDIMAEIESLESECEVGSLTAKKDKVDLQAEIEQELETSMESSEESKVIPLIKNQRQFQYQHQHQQVQKFHLKLMAK